MMPSQPQASGQLQWAAVPPLQPQQQQQPQQQAPQHQQLQQQHQEQRTTSLNNTNAKGSGQVRKIFIGGIPQEMSQDDLHTFFNDQHPVKRAWLQRYRTTGSANSTTPPHNHRGFGFVIFQSGAAVDQLLGSRSSCHLQLPGGRQLEIKRAVSSNDLKLSTSAGGRDAKRETQPMSEQQLINSGVRAHALVPNHPDVQSAGAPPPQMMQAHDPQLMPPQQIQQPVQGLPTPWQQPYILQQTLPPFHQHPPALQHQQASIPSGGSQWQVMPLCQMPYPMQYGPNGQAHYQPVQSAQVPQIPQQLQALHQPGYEHQQLLSQQASVGYQPLPPSYMCIGGGPPPQHWGPILSYPVA